jgi:hypothetical protein
MRKTTLFFLFVMGLAAGALPAAIACKEALPIAKDVLTITELACVATTELTDVKAVADFCAIDIKASPALVDVIQQLIDQRQAAKRAGFRWNADGGAPAPRDAGGG